MKVVHDVSKFMKAQQKAEAESWAGWGEHNV